MPDFIPSYFLARVLVGLRKTTEATNPTAQTNIPECKEYEPPEAADDAGVPKTSICYGLKALNLRYNQLSFKKHLLIRPQILVGSNI